MKINRILGQDIGSLCIRCVTGLVFLLSICPWFSTRCHAQMLDASFGASGVATLDLGPHDALTSLAVAPDGSIFLLGSTFAGSNRNVFIAKYDSSGQLVATFGGFGPMLAGTVVTDISGDDMPSEIRILDDGKILVLCESENDGIVLVRYEGSGHKDVTFGSNFSGEMIVDAPIYQLPGPVGTIDLWNPVGMEILGDKILIAGANGIVQCNWDGTRDMTFGTNGMVRPDALTGGEFGINALAMDGPRIVLAGTHWSNEGVFARFIGLTLNGLPDAAFGDGGVLGTPRNVLSDVSAMQVNNGLITAAGNGRVIQMNQTGVLRANFAMNGVVDLVPEGEVTDVQLMTYGRVAVAIDLPDEGANELAVARQLTDGTADPQFAHSTFGFPEAGWLHAAFGHAATARRLFAYANGKMLVAGDYRDVNLQGDGIKDVVLMRLEATSEGTPSGNGGGTPGGFDSNKRIDTGRGEGATFSGGFQALAN